MKSLPALSPLIAMSARVQQLEADRRRLFTQWLAALEGSDGNVTKAAGRMKPPISRNRANKITRKFNLVEYTKALRAAVLKNPQGRPYPKK